MKTANAAFIVTFITGVFSTAAIAGTACPANNASVPTGANTTDRTAPFFINTSGLSLKTSPPTRDPGNPLYLRATALPDGKIPSPTADGNFVLSASHPIRQPPIRSLGSRRPCRNGDQLEQRRRVHHGLVSSAALSSCSCLFTNNGEPAVAA